MCSPDNSRQSIDRLSFMLAVPDTARADVTMTADKVYYRFATEDTLEDGELPGSKHNGFEEFARNLLGVFSSGVAVSAPIDPVRFTLFVNNTKVIPQVLNNRTLGLFIDKLMACHDEFSFLGGFKD